MQATDGTSRILQLRSNRARWPIVASLAATIVFVLAIGLFMVVRRCAGALSEPLPGPQLLVTAACLLVWALVVTQIADDRRVSFWITLSTLLLFAIGCSFPASRLVDWLAWLPTLGLVIWSPAAAALKQRLTTRPVAPPNEASEKVEQVIQQLTRLRMADGKDALRGSLVAEFAPGERQTTMYVGFCPPFEMMPQVDVNVDGELEADIKLVQVLHNGAQLEVRLSEPADDALAVSLELFAVEG